MPGLTWNIVKSPMWKTAIQQAVSGKEVRTAYRSRPIWKFSLSYEFLRGGSGFTELQQMVSFFNLRRGSFDSFLLLDDSDSTATAQRFGTGDGVTKTFPLLHAINGWVEPIGFCATPTVFVAGGAQSSPAQFTTDGASVTFVTAPTAGQALTWSGTFYYRVRFDKDIMEYDQFMKNLWQLKKCELVGVI